MKIDTLCLCSADDYQANMFADNNECDMLHTVQTLVSCCFLTDFRVFSALEVLYEEAGTVEHDHGGEKGRTCYIDIAECSDAESEELIAQLEPRIVKYWRGMNARVVAGGGVSRPCPRLLPIGLCDRNM